VRKKVIYGQEFKIQPFAGERSDLRLGSDKVFNRNPFISQNLNPAST
jgi:hypothetical protein